jgi:hypothetical protein
MLLSLLGFGRVTGRIGFGFNARCRSAIQSGLSSIVPGRMFVPDDYLASLYSMPSSCSSEITAP